MPAGVRMIAQFWGVRGSVPVPGRDTLKYGGNTACVSLDVDGRMLILDAGTGIRPLGSLLANSKHDLCILLSHAHADHISGFPFFAPIYETERCIDVIDFEFDGRTWSLLQLFDGLHSPVQPVQAAAVCRHAGPAGFSMLRRKGFDVTAIPLNHPGGAWGFRILNGGRSFVYMTDNEIDAVDGRTSFDTFAAFCRGADVLVHDAQFLATEMARYAGWGHSSVDRACDLAVAAGVQRLILFHHDPGRTDAALDAIGADARARIAPHDIRCDVAWEGLTLTL